VNQSRQYAEFHKRFLVRRTTSRDLEVLVRHRRGMWKDLGIAEGSALDEADRAYRRWAKSRFRNGQLLGWIVETKSGVTAGSGCLWLQPTQPRPNRRKQVQPYLLSMYTDQYQRRKGVASGILREAIGWCRSNGYSRLTLHASRNGRELYRKHGFNRSWEMKLNLE
jgi:GNAT superfamily N-acetyltransferase